MGPRVALPVPTGYISFVGEWDGHKAPKSFLSMYGKHAVWVSVILQKLILNGKK